jgi:hypothetical protein
LVGRVLLVLAALAALYGCGRSPETKAPFEGVEPLGSEASTFATEALTGQNVGPEFDVVEQEDQYGRLLAYVYLDCGYAETCRDEGPDEPSIFARVGGVADRVGPWLPQLFGLGALLLAGGLVVARQAASHPNLKEIGRGAVVAGAMMLLVAVPMYLLIVALPIFFSTEQIENIFDLLSNLPGA